MGTIAQKIARSLDTKEGLKNTINTYLGQDITDAIPFKDYETYIKNFYNSLPKTDYAEGSNITLSNTLKGKLDYENGVVGIGNIEQDTTEGYNLAPIVDNRYTLDNDNIISISRHDDNNGIVYTQFDVRSGETIYLYFIKYSNITNAISFVGNSANANLSFTNVQGFTNNTLYQRTYTATSDITIKITMWGNTNNETLKFQLWATKNEAKNTFEPYTNGASPNPSYPQEIKYVRGKNRFDKNAVTQNAYINTSGEVVTGAVGYCASDWIKVSTGNIVWGATSGNGYSLLIYNSSKTFIRAVGRTNNNAMVIPIANGEEYIRFTILNADLNTMQIEEGSTSTPYLPYNTIEEVVSGKNLFIPELTTEGVEIGQVRCSITINNGEYTITPSGADFYYGGTRSTGSAWTGGFGTLYDISKYSTLVLKLTNTNLNKNYVNFYDSNKISLGYSQIDNTTGLITRPENAKYCSFRIGKQTYTEGDVFKTYIQLESGSVTSTYEPYITPTPYQLSLGDIQLCGIGNYTDELIYDVDEDKVYKNEKIGKYELPQIVEAIRTGTVLDTPNTYYTIIRELQNIIDIAPVTEISYNWYCNKLHRANGIVSDYGAYIVTGSGDTNMVIIVNSNDTLESLNQKLNNNVFYYQKTTPTLTEITDTTLINQVKALYNAQSINGTTILEVDGDLPLIIKTRALKGA